MFLDQITSEVSIKVAFAIISRSLRESLRLSLLPLFTSCFLQLRCQVLPAKQEIECVQSTIPFVNVDNRRYETC